MQPDDTFLHRSAALGLSDVAAMLGMAPGTFRNKRRALERDHSFPRPLPGCGTKWSAHQVRMWIDSNGCTAAPDDAADPVAVARAALEARLEGRAA